MVGLYKIEWIDRLNNRRLLEPIGYIPPVRTRASLLEVHGKSGHGGWTQLTESPEKPGRTEMELDNENIPSEPVWVETQAYRDVRNAIEAGISPVLLIGAPGTGKTRLLYQLRGEWTRNGRSACLISLHDIHGEYDLFRALTAQLGFRERHDLTVNPLILVSSANRLGHSLASVIDSQEQPPLVLLDGLDEVRERDGVFRAVRLLCRTRASVVVSSRRPELDKVDGLGVTIEVGPFSHAELADFLRRAFPDQRATELASSIYSITKGNALVATLAAALGGSFIRDGRGASLGDLTPRVLIEWLFDRTLERENARARSKDLLTALARVSIRGHLPLSDLNLDTEGEKLLLASPLVRLSGGTVSLVHASLATVIFDFASVLPARTLHLRELDLGAAEAERDTLLSSSYIAPPRVTDLYSGATTIVVGDRGAGKSALFSMALKLSTQLASKDLIFALPDPSAQIAKLVSDDRALMTAEQFRAAWLLALACGLATRISFNSAELRRSAIRLRALAPGVAPDGTPLGRMLTTWYRMRRASVKFQLGPVVLEPGKSTTTRSSPSLDIEEFLDHCSTDLATQGKRAVFAVDRVDEAFKYDRTTQEKLVQGLFLAESGLARTPSINLLVFIRTDLFEVYDIQEKNKLVSRTLNLTWTRDALLRLCVQRVLANAQLANLAALLTGPSGLRLADALAAIWPGEVESTPFVDWLWNCLRNGNGDVSPRQLVLLLLLTQKAPPLYDYAIDSIPVFREPVLSWAMTELSELSFKEVTNDFRVAPTFLRNCRAGKIDTFTATEVESLMNTDEGPRGMQFEMLEKLGVLERVVVRESDGSQRAKFRFPLLYTRCWTIPESSV